MNKVSEMRASEIVLENTPKGDSKATGPRGQSRQSVAVDKVLGAVAALDKFRRDVEAQLDTQDVRLDRHGARMDRHNSELGDVGIALNG